MKIKLIQLTTEGAYRFLSAKPVKGHDNYLQAGDGGYVMEHGESGYAIQYGIPYCEDITELRTLRPSTSPRWRSPRITTAVLAIEGEAILVPDNITTSENDEEATQKAVYNFTWHGMQLAAARAEKEYDKAGKTNPIALIVLSALACALFAFCVPLLLRVLE